jgi:hypothetical protein
MFSAGDDDKVRFLRTSTGKGVFMDIVTRIERNCRGLGRTSVADTIRSCAETIVAENDANESAIMLACLKVSSRVRVPCADLAALFLALYRIAGIAIDDAQRVVDSDAVDLPYNGALRRLRSLWVATDGCDSDVPCDDRLALEALGRLLRRFEPESLALEELVLVLSSRPSRVSRNTPYSVAERVRVAMGASCSVTATTARADFRFGALRVVAVRDACAGSEIRDVLDEGAESRSGLWAVLLIAPVSPFTYESVVARAPLVFSVDAAETRPSFRGEWVVFGHEAARVRTPETLLADPRARLAAMDKAWRVVADVFTPNDPSECLLAVQLCVSSAASCLGAASCVSIVDSVLGAMRGGAPVELCEWHPDLARAAAVLAISLTHNVLSHVGDAERAQPALAALLLSPMGFSDRLACAYDALLGIVAQAGGPFAAMCALISPVPVTVAELLYVLYALFRARLQTIRDVEAELGCGHLVSVDVRVDVAAGFIHAFPLVALD